ncbi:MAG: hypothetical protein JJ902_14670 [Roseibium sp.]|nr:hypothetical protein [Roseibium sp.]
MADYALIELLLVFGGALAFLTWQYWSVNRDIRERERREAEENERSASDHAAPPKT